MGAAGLARPARPGCPPRAPWRGLLAAALLVAASAAGAAEPAAPTPPALVRGGLRIVLDSRELPAAEAPHLTGRANAPAGSTVAVTIGDRTASTTLAGSGQWSLAWPAPLPPGETRVEITVTGTDGRRARVERPLRVLPPGRLPRRPVPPAAPVLAEPPGPAIDDFQEATDRWRIAPPPYELNAPSRPWDPYNRNRLKGDLPILGQDKFLVLTVVSDSLTEPRRLPTPSGISTAEPDLDFFGDSDQLFATQNAFFSADFFRGDTAFRPVDWRLKGTLAANLNYIDTAENAVVNPDVRRGENRTDSRFALQELFVEIKLADRSPSFDFLSLRAGIQPFNSDFRGFIFNDVNLGVRLFGNRRANRYQYNLAVFERLEKDTNSGLNTFELRDQRVAVANFYWQDFLTPGLTGEFSIHYVRDEATFLFDRNGFLARPDATGDFTPHEVEATYLGWAGFGRAGRVNLDAAAYYAFGTDSLNPIAGRQLVLADGGFRFVDEVDISAYLAAFEVSYDHDWWRPRLALLVASGDDNLADRDAEGFDAIFENINFAGGGFSLWNRLGIRLTGTAVALVSRGTPLPDLSSSKEEGQPNFVNPGLELASAGIDLELTPRLKAILTANYLRFAATEVLEGLLFQAPIAREIGWDLSAGLRYRPYLNQNVVVVAGAAALLPGQGFEQIFADGDPLYHVFANLILTY